MRSTRRRGDVAGEVKGKGRGRRRGEAVLRGLLSVAVADRAPWTITSTRPRPRPCTRCSRSLWTTPPPRDGRTTSTSGDSTTRISTVRQASVTCAAMCYSPLRVFSYKYAKLKDEVHNGNGLYATLLEKGHST